MQEAEGQGEEDNGEDLVVFMNSLDKEADGKLLMNTKTQPAFVRCIRVMARQAGLPHRYSPEFLFAHEFTTHYEEFCFHLPEFGRLRELTRMTALVQFLNRNRELNKKKLASYDHYLSGKKLDLHDPVEKSVNDIVTPIKKNVHDIFERKKREGSHYWSAQSQVADIRKQIGQLTVSEHSTEVNDACERFYQQVKSENSWATRENIFKDVIEPQRAEIAKTISSSKRQSWKEALKKCFDDKLKSRMSETRYDQMLEDFLNGSDDALVNEISSKMDNDSWWSFTNSFSASTSTEISDAYYSRTTHKIDQVAEKEARYQLEKLRDNDQRVEQGYRNIGLGEITPPEERDLDDECVWIPSSINHHYYTDGGRHSLFVFGGVKSMPTLNVKHDGGPLQGERVNLARAAGGSGNLPPRGPGGKPPTSGDFFGGGGGSGGGGGGKTPGGNGGSGNGKGSGDDSSQNSNDGNNKKSLRHSDAILYQKIGPNGEHLKFGITKNPKTRYTTEQLNGGKLKIIARGTRQEMLELERNLHATLPIGPEERQTGYVNIQSNKGYKIPPYK